MVTGAENTTARAGPVSTKYGSCMQQLNKNMNLSGRKEKKYSALK
jgi:hypothetical protein